MWSPGPPRGRRCGSCSDGCPQPVGGPRRFHGSGMPERQLLSQSAAREPVRGRDEAPAEPTLCCRLLALTFARQAPPVEASKHPGLQKCSRHRARVISGSAFFAADGRTRSRELTNTAEATLGGIDATRCSWSSSLSISCKVPARSAQTGTKASLKKPRTGLCLGRCDNWWHLPIDD